MHPNATLIQQFYTAFQAKNYGVMQDAYHTGAVFSDPVFQGLSSKEVKCMWQMLITSAKDMEITCSDISADETTGRCVWQAWYTFTTTGRKVHNIIHASFAFREGKIYRHNDHFNFWRWSGMALGTPGLLLGWSPLIRNKVRKTARRRLEKFMHEIK
jgi:ketosteroid isomerase-like protein